MAEQTKPLPLQWNQLCLEVIGCAGFPPPLAARALAMVHTAMYGAWSVYNQKSISTSTAQCIKKLERRYCTAEIRQKAYSYAAYRVLRDLFWLALLHKNKGMYKIQSI